MPHLARLSRLCRGRPRPCSRRVSRGAFHSSFLKWFQAFITGLAYLLLTVPLGQNCLETHKYLPHALLRSVGAFFLEAVNVFGQFLRHRRARRPSFHQDRGSRSLVPCPYACVWTLEHSSISISLSICHAKIIAIFYVPHSYFSRDLTNQDIR